MTDLFTSYAADKANVRTKPKPAAADLSPLEKKMRERQRLNRDYRAWRRADTKSTLASEPRLSGFLRYLRTVTAETGDDLIEAIETSWLIGSPQPVRLFALRMIDVRCNKINQMLGNEPLDDPIPPDTSIYFQARALLHAGGRG